MTKIGVIVTRKSRTRQLLPQYLDQAKQIVAAGGNMVRNTAVQSIQSHQSSGRVYEKYNPRRTHTASTAGNPPNTDTGFLVNNIHVIIDPDGLGADVESRADYSEALEFGTSKMGARPFLQPALEENRSKIRAMYRRMKARTR
tara:strand:- start:1848 stop:2276 length:429 start_codon:yes stop_codon:yes gene_type:complete